MPWIDCWASRYDVSPICTHMSYLYHIRDFVEVILPIKPDKLLFHDEIAYTIACYLYQSRSMKLDNHWSCICILVYCLSVLWSGLVACDHAGRTVTIGTRVVYVIGIIGTWVILADPDIDIIGTWVIRAVCELFVQLILLARELSVQRVDTDPSP